jgi:hypothetical protein
LAQQPIAAFVGSRIRHRHASSPRFQRDDIACAKLFLPVYRIRQHVRPVNSNPVDFSPPRMCAGEPKNELRNVS